VSGPTERGIWTDIVWHVLDGTSELSATAKGRFTEQIVDAVMEQTRLALFAAAPDPLTDLEVAVKLLDALDEANEFRPEIRRMQMTILSATGREQ